MSTTTTNLELVKPAGNERVDVDVINGNYDKIDEFAGLAITDANYVHTDNNYTTTEKNKLSAIQPNATATSFTQTLVSGTAVGTITINGTAYTIYAPAASGGASALNDLSDVTLASPSNGQVLKYNSTTGKWENADESGGGGGYIPTGEVYTFFTDGSAAAANYTLYVQWTDGETVTTALIVSYSELISGWTTGDYQDVTINWDRTNQNFNFVAKSGSFECNGTYFDEGDTMGTLSSGNITFNAMEKEATGVDWTQVQLSGTKIAEIEIDGVSQNVYAPTPPTKTSDLTNDSNFVADASYVHTDNNYTQTEKNKLADLNQVEANPSSGTSAGNLNSIEIGGTKYDIPSGGGGGTTVIANPSGEATAELEKLQVGSTIYSIPSSGSASWKDITGTLTAGQTEITLADPIITAASTLEPFTDKFGVNPTDMEVLGHTYEGQVNDILTAQDLTKVTASSNETSVNSKEWKAFDGADGDTNGNSWLPARDDAPCWLQYEFSTAKYISEVKLHCFNNLSNLNYNAPAKIQASNDGTTWTDISESTNIQLTGTTPADITFTCDESQSWTYVRLYSETCLLVYGGASCFVGEMEIYGGTLGTPSLKLTFPVQSENLNVKVRVS